MNKIILILLLLFSTMEMLAQEKSNRLRVAPYFRFDSYPKIIFSYAGRSSTDALKMKGISPGLIVYYDYHLNKNWFLNLGLGYYQYSFTKLDRVNSMFGLSHARPIEYPSVTNFFYHTRRYKYNCVQISFGLEKQYSLNKDLQFSTGLNYSGYLNIKSVYNFNYSGGFNYRKDDFSLFAHSLMLNLAVRKKLKTFFIGPRILVPVIDSWRQDESFLENKSDKRSKWFNGVGFAIDIEIPLSQ